MVPAVTRSTLSLIRALICLAASAERPARLRTSDATTAKPRPCSPARAASTAAFSARMLVWKAMPSITPMMSAILLLLSWMPFMVSTTWLTTSPPCTATVDALCASWLACRALSAFWRTVELSCSMDAAVSCSALACCSVRALRSLLPWAISDDAVATFSEPERTCPTMRDRFCCISFSDRSRCAISLRLSPTSGMWTDRLPWLISSAACTARCTGPTMERVVHSANKAPSTSDATAASASTHWLVTASWMMVPSNWSSCLCVLSATSASDCR